MRLLLLSCEEPHMCAQEAAGICAMLSLKAGYRSMNSFTHIIMIIVIIIIIIIIITINDIRQTTPIIATMIMFNTTPSYCIIGRTRRQEPWLPTPNIDRLQACKQSFAVYEGDLVSVLNIFRQHQTYRGNDRRANKHGRGSKLCSERVT